MAIADELFFREKQRLPVVLSSEIAECGLACVAMVAGYHGHHVDLNALRQRYPVSAAGANLRGLASVLDSLGLSSRALRATLDGLRKISCPTILHWNFNHFVVLKEISARGAVVHDPSQGLVRYTLAEFSNYFTGIALEVIPTVDLQPKKAGKGLRLTQLWSLATGLRRGLIQVGLLSVALQLIVFMLPLQIQLVIDKALQHNDSGLLASIALGFGMLVCFQAITSAIRDWTVQLLSNQFIYQVVGNVFRHLISLPASYFEHRHVGDIMSRIGSVRTIQEAISQGIVPVLIDGFMAIIATILAFLYAPQLTAIVLLSIGLLAVSSLAFYPAISNKTNQGIMSSANEQTYLIETIRAVVPVKIMGREAERESTWRNLYVRNFNISMSIAKSQISLTMIQNIILGLQLVLVIYMGGKGILSSQHLSIGMLAAFLSFRQILTDRALSLVTKGLQFRMLGLHLDRLNDIVAQQPEDRSPIAVAVPVSGGIRLTNVSFRYGISDPWIFRDFELDIQPGEFVAITGPSGSGKSTLLRTLLGLLPPDTGDVWLDGQRATPGTWRAWRSHVGVVAQDDQLFSGNLADNIAFFDSSLDMEKVISAASRAQVHDDIMRMPMNYMTPIGDMGSSLSGGQKQRVLLARALYRDPKVLILDEGTANLDPTTEDMIVELIANLPVTRIVVAHRPALIRRAGRVVEIKDGNIRELSDGVSDLTLIQQTEHA